MTYLKKILVYLYLYFDGDIKAIEEFIDNDKKLIEDANVINSKLKNIKLDDYLAYFENGFNEELKKQNLATSPILILKRSRN